MYAQVCYIWCMKCTVQTRPCTWQVELLKCIAGSPCCFNMAALFDSKSLPVILKKLQSDVDLSILEAAVVSKRCQILAALGADDRLILWSIRSDARWSLPCVKQ